MSRSYWTERKGSSTLVKETTRGRQDGDCQCPLRVGEGNGANSSKSDRSSSSRPRVARLRSDQMAMVVASGFSTISAPSDMSQLPINTSPTSSMMSRQKFPAAPAGNLSGLSCPAQLRADKLD